MATAEKPEVVEGAPSDDGGEEEVAIKVKDLVLRTFWKALHHAPGPGVFTQALIAATSVYNACGYVDDGDEDGVVQGWVYEALGALATGAEIIERSE